jgi:hypothetical protein
MQDGIDRLTMCQGVVNESDIPTSCCRVKLEIRDWMNVIRMIVMKVDTFSEFERELLKTSKFGRRPGRGVPEKGRVSIVANGHGRHGHGGRIVE